MAIGVTHFVRVLAAMLCLTPAWFHAADAQPRPELARPHRPAPDHGQDATEAGAMERDMPLYRVGAGDRLKVSVYNVDKLTGEYLVGGDGKIAVPILGRVPVGGMTLDDIAAHLAARLGDGYFINPNVTVDIAAYRPVYILGEVQRPGQYPFAEGMTINRLVAAAGGYTYRANRRTMRVRREPGATAPAQVGEDGAVMPGDTVYIGERYF